MTTPGSLPETPDSQFSATHAESIQDAGNPLPSDDSAPSDADDASAEGDSAPEDLSAETEPVEEDEGPLPETFAEMAFSPKVHESLAAANFSKPTPIQARFIPKAMTGRDVMGQARTGTGKTCAFLVPIFERIIPEPGKVQAIILAPTRELAIQIEGEILRLGSKLGFTSITLYGGSSYEPQIDALKKGVNIIVGTPGRIMDHMRSGRLDLSAVKIAVLDEADRMLDLGFRKDIEYILRHCPKERQTLLLSATIPPDIMRLAHKFMNDPLEVWTAGESLSVDTIEQSYFIVDRENKLAHLLKLLDTERPQLAIIFCGTKMGAKRLAEKLTRLHIAAREIHGDLQQSRREKIMGRFRSGKIKLLIATDVASRGIDVNNITHVINYDIPYKTEDYVHRIGRTGRIGKTGKAYTFVFRDEGEYLTNIELMVNHEIKRLTFDELTSTWWPTPPAKPDPDYYESREATAAAEGEAAPEGVPTGLPPVPGSASGKKKRRRGGKKRKEGAAHPFTDKPPVSETITQELHAAPIPFDMPGDAVAEGLPLTFDVDGLPSDTHEDGLDEARVSRSIPKGENVHGVPSSPSGERRNSRSGRGRDRSRSRSPRTSEPVAVTCSECGTQTTVNFVPNPDKPIFCQPCYKARKASKAAAGASSEPAASPAPAPTTDAQ